MNDAGFFNVADQSRGIPRELAEGLTARIYVGDRAMVSVVTVAPHAESQVHDHPEEQWGVLVEGNGVRIQGGREIPISAGDFWLTPGGVPHGLRAGAQGARVLDFFAPPRLAYTRPGTGFG